MLTRRGGCRVLVCLRRGCGGAPLQLRWASTDEGKSEDGQGASGAYETVDFAVKNGQDIFLSERALADPSVGKTVYLVPAPYLAPAEYWKKVIERCDAVDTVYVGEMTGNTQGLARMGSAWKLVLPDIPKECPQKRVRLVHPDMVMPHKMIFNRASFFESRRQEAVAKVMEWVAEDEGMQIAVLYDPSALGDMRAKLLEAGWTDMARSDYHLASLSAGDKRIRSIAYMQHTRMFKGEDPIEAVGTAGAFMKAAVATLGLFLVFYSFKWIFPPPTQHYVPVQPGAAGPYGQYTAAPPPAPWGAPQQQQQPHAYQQYPPQGYPQYQAGLPPPPPPPPTAGAA